MLIKLQARSASRSKAHRAQKSVLSVLSVCDIIKDKGKVLPNWL